MKSLDKVLSSEQKVAVVDFVANWIRQGKDLQEGVGSTYLIKDGKVMYMISMSLFDKEHLSYIVVMNYDLDISLSVDVDDIPAQSKSDIIFIENHIKGLQIVLGVGMDLTDKEFNVITNLEPDLGMSRSKKISHIKDKLKEDGI